MSAQFWHTVEAWASQPQLLALGGALLHFLWQGAIIALILAVTLRAMHGRSSNLRYLAAYAALLAMAVCPVMTYMWLSNGTPATVVDASAATAPGPETTLVAADQSVGDPVDTPSARVHAEAEAPRAAVRPAASSSGGFALVNTLRPFAPWMVAMWLTGVVVLSVRLCVGWA